MALCQLFKTASLPKALLQCHMTTYPCQLAEGITAALHDDLSVGLTCHSK